MMKTKQTVAAILCGLASLVTAENLDAPAGMYIKDNATIYYQTLDDNVIMDLDGTPYSLAELTPYGELFDSDRFSIDADIAVDLETGEEFQVTVYRSDYLDGTTVIASVDEELILTEAKILSRTSVTRVIRDGTSNEYMTFASDVFDYDYIDSHFHFAEAPPDPDNERRGLRQGLSTEKLNIFESNRNLQQCRHQRGNRNDNTAADCNFCFKTINVAIMYDVEFCAAFGYNVLRAREAIQDIVTTASVMYEKDMCVKINLVGIYSPDRCSPGTVSHFSTMNRDNPCVKDDVYGDFLRDLTADMKVNKGPVYNIPPGTAVHAFTGVMPSTGTIGCAFIGTMCNDGWNYGVNYILWNRDRTLQSVMFAHELGHNLGGQHSEEAGHVMFKSIGTPEFGFSSLTIETVLNYLNNANNNCDSDRMYINRPPVRPPAPSPPAPPPVNIPRETPPPRLPPPPANPRPPLGPPPAWPPPPANPRPPPPAPPEGTPAPRRTRAPRPWPPLVRIPPRPGPKGGKRTNKKGKRIGK